jgi:radical SAM superfamily enzyme YgiQ (UPF0313 family)
MQWKIIDKSRRRVADEIALLSPAGGGDIHVALGYPNTYRVGMSHLGIQLIYAFLNQIPGVVCERFFLPDTDELEWYRASGTPLLTLESQRPVGEHDVVAFTCNYEPDYVNILKMLELAGLPLWQAEREDNDPLVLLGGAVTLLNPEPMADFFDFICVGEGESMMEPMIESLRQTVGQKRQDRLRELAQIKAFYVPNLYTPRYADGLFCGLEPAAGVPEKVQKNYIDRELFANQDTHSVVLTDETEFGKSFLIEVSRGCPYICRFCTVGFSYPKVRWRSVEQIWKSIEKVKPHHPKVGLISATVGNHPEIKELCQKLMEADLAVGFSSLRSDQLPDVMIQAMVKSGARSMTLAPETGSESLRRSINKRFSDESYFGAAERAFRGGITNLKMYSMVGLPNEAEDDIDALITLVKRTREVQRKSGKAAGRITLGMGLFVPKPLTPYQWAPQLGIKDAKKRMQKVKRALGGLGGVRVTSESPRIATLEGLLARADRRMGRVLESVRWDPSYGSYKKSLAEHGLSFEQENYRTRDAEEALPWGHIEASWPKDRLLKDALRAQREKARVVTAPQARHLPK